MLFDSVLGRPGFGGRTEGFGIFQWENTGGKVGLWVYACTRMHHFFQEFHHKEALDPRNYVSKKDGDTRIQKATWTLNNDGFGRGIFLSTIKGFF